MKSNTKQKFAPPAWFVQHYGEQVFCQNKKAGVSVNSHLSLDGLTLTVIIHQHGRVLEKKEISLQGA